MSAAQFINVDEPSQDKRLAWPNTPSLAAKKPSAPAEELPPLTECVLQNDDLVLCRTAAEASAALTKYGLAILLPPTVHDGAASQETVGMVDRGTLVASAPSLIDAFVEPNLGLLKQVMGEPLIFNAFCQNVMYNLQPQQRATGPQLHARQPVRKGQADQMINAYVLVGPNGAAGGPFGGGPGFVLRGDLANDLLAKVALVSKAPPETNARLRVHRNKFPDKKDAGTALLAALEAVPAALVFPAIPHGALIFTTGTTLTRAPCSYDVGVNVSDDALEHFAQHPLRLKADGSLRPKATDEYLKSPPEHGVALVELGFVQALTPETARAAGDAVRLIRDGDTKKFTGTFNDWLEAAVVAKKKAQSAVRKRPAASSSTGEPAQKKKKGGDDDDDDEAAEKKMAQQWGDDEE